MLALTRGSLQRFARCFVVQEFLPRARHSWGRISPSATPPLLLLVLGAAGGCWGAAGGAISVGGDIEGRAELEAPLLQAAQQCPGPLTRAL